MQKTQVRTGGSFHSVASRRRSTRQYLEKIISKSRVGNNIRFFGLGTSGGGGADLLLPTCRVLRYYGLLIPVRVLETKMLDDFSTYMYEIPNC